MWIFFPEVLRRGIFLASKIIFDWGKFYYNFDIKINTPKKSKNIYNK